MELRRLREAAGVSPEGAAERIGGDRTKINRQENGRQGVSKLEVEALLDLYNVPEGKLRAAIAALQKESRRKGWWRQHGDSLGLDLQERINLESDAAKILAFQPLVLPGLVQTPAYARALMKAATPSIQAEELDQLVEVRMTRQQIFERDKPPQYVCVLDEAVLRRGVGVPHVRADQLRRLLEVNDLPRVSIQVIPFEQGWHTGLDGAFSIYTYPDPMQLDVVGIEYLDGALYLEDDERVARFQFTFDQLRSVALSSRQSMDLITDLASDLDKRQEE